MPSRTRSKRSTDPTPTGEILVMEGIAALARVLPAIVRAPTDRDARSDALYGAWACGVCCSVGMALHHKLCHVLGGSLDLPHAVKPILSFSPTRVAYNEFRQPRKPCDRWLAF